MQAGGETLLIAINRLINSIWKEEELPISGGSLLLYEFIKRVIKLAVIIIMGYHCYQNVIKYLSPMVKSTYG
jgi:hypothetical protein